MPTYEYSCQKCGSTFEVFQSMRDAPLTVCTCGKKGKVRRLVGRGAGIIFKGSGFYETDYKRRSPKPKGEKSDGHGQGPGSAAPAPSAKGQASPPAAGGASEKK